MSTLRNLIATHLNNEEVQAVETALQQLETALSSKMCNLSAEERRRYGSISEQNKLLVNKVYDYANGQPQLRSPDVNWDEFKLDYASRAFLEGVIHRMHTLLSGITNAKTLHDYDNYQAALDDYAYTSYKVHTAAVGYEDKRNELKQFFTRTKGSAETPPEEQDNTKQN